MTFSLTYFSLFFLSYHSLEKVLLHIYCLLYGLFQLKKKKKGLLDIYLAIFKQLDTND